MAIFGANNWRRKATEAQTEVAIIANLKNNDLLEVFTSSGKKTGDWVRQFLIESQDC